MKKWIYIILIFLGCSKTQDADQAIPVALETPKSLNDGIGTVSAAELGFDENLLSQLYQGLESETYGKIKSFLISKDYKLFFEFTGSSTFNQQYYIQSATKSFTGALIGIAIDQGLLKKDDLIQPYFSEYPSIIWTNGKEDITVEHLLTMTTGIQWNETQVPYEDSSNIHNQLNQSDDWIKFILEQPMETQPGTKFNYNSGASILLGYILDETIDENFYEYSTANLFEPLGIESFIWVSTNGVYQTGGGLAVKPRDMLKFGHLYLNNGVFMDTQILSSVWVNYTFNHSPNSNEYTVQWWKSKLSHNGKIYTVNYAWGNGGQFIVLVKELNLVITLTSDNFGDNGYYRDELFKIIEKYILSSI